MQINCQLIIDKKGRELRSHGDLSFPCACYHSGPNQGNVPWHWHEEIELVLVTGGKVQCAAGNQRFLLQKGDALFINSGIPHAVFQNDDESYEESDIVFHPRFIYGDVGSIFYEKYIAPMMQCTSLPCFCFQQDASWQTKAISFLKGAIDACTQKDSLYEFTVSSSLSHMISLLWQNQQEKILLTKQKPPILLERLKTMLDYIHSNFQQPIALDVLSAQATICKRECQRIFKAELGMTPTQYIEQYRLAAAIRLLSETDHNILEIGEQCGFQSASYFTMKFHERYGITPSVFRVSLK